MSIIRAQALRYSFINYFATGLAAISTLWIYPLELDAYGLAQLLVSLAAFCIPIATMGTYSIIVKFFPEYKSMGLSKSFLYNVLILGFGTFALALIVAILINRPILKLLDFLHFDAYVVAKHKYVMVALIAVMLYNSLLVLHASNYNKISIPSAYQNLIPKLVLPVLILGLYWHYYNTAMFTKLWVLSFMIASIGLTLYLWRIGALDLQRRLTFFSKERIKNLFGYSGYMGASTVGTMLVSKIDLIMVGTLLTLKDTGVYGMALFIGNVLVIPATGIWQIASPVISEAFGNHNLERVKDVYKKSSINLLLTGVFIYFFILGTLDPVLMLSPNYQDIATTLPLFVVMGLSKLIEMGASVNQHILMFSPKYKRVLVFVAIMAVINILLSYFLITNIGILGAALATCITTYLYQLIKVLYIEKEFGMHPFSKMTPRIFVLFLVVMLYYLLLPKVAPPIIQAMIYSVGLVIVYVATVRVLKIKSDVTDTIEERVKGMITALRKK